MRSSPGFVSNPCHSSALFRLAFAAPPGVNPLGSPQKLTRWLILQKARHHRVGQPHPALTVCRHPVSDSLSLPSPGFFSPFPHGTIRYRSSDVFSLGTWSSQLHAGFLVSRTTQDPGQFAPLPPTGLSPPPAGLPRPFGFSLRPFRQSCNPAAQWATVWATPLSLATTRRIISSPRATQMFHFARFPLCS